MKKIIKNTALSLIVVGLISFVIARFYRVDKNPLAGKEFVGYIPKDALPKLHREESESHPGQWNEKFEIKTVIGKDTFEANFPSDGYFPGSKFIVFKFPFNIDTIVYVRGHYDQDGIPWINSEASLMPLKEQKEID